MPHLAAFPVRWNCADSLVMVTAPKIRQLTDVSHCKLHQYLCCNSKIRCQAA